MFPDGATLEGPNGRGWVLDEGDGAPALGAALAWAKRRSIVDLNLLVDNVSGAASELRAATAARRAAEMADPPQVWAVTGRLVSRASPGPVSSPAAPPLGARALVGVFENHDVDIVAEHGVITAEVLGLEVARIVPIKGAHRAADEPEADASAADGSGTSGSETEGTKWCVMVGVGEHDRDARSEMRPDEDLGLALDDVVLLIRQLRASGARRHPANTLCRERWMRRVLLDDPASVGAALLAPVEPPEARRDLRRPAIAPAVGITPDGRPIVVVCSAGVDLELIPTAVDVRLRESQRDAALKVVVPAGDDHPITRELAAGLLHPAEVVVMPGGSPWA